MVLTIPRFELGFDLVMFCKVKEDNWITNFVVYIDSVAIRLENPEELVRVDIDLSFDMIKY